MTFNLGRIHTIIYRALSSENKICDMNNNWNILLFEPILTRVSNSSQIEVGAQPICIMIAANIVHTGEAFQPDEDSSVSREAL